MADGLHSALFLDRDGVINRDTGYVSQIADFQWMPGIFETCRLASEFDFRLIVVTNQSGIGRGLYSEADFEALTAYMLAQFKEKGVEITAVYHAPYFQGAQNSRYLQQAYMRKPNPGMLLVAARDHAINLTQSALLGDKDSDAKAAIAAGLPHIALLSHPDDGMAERVTFLKNHHDACQWLRAIGSQRG